MASIGNDPNGAKRILFMANGKRKTIRLGKATMRQALAFKVKVEALIGYCETVSCRRQVLLGYFGEVDHPQCGNCDNCCTPVPSWDGTIAAQKALSAIYRTGQRFGTRHLVDVLGCVYL